MVPHTTHCSHLILILAYGEIVGIPFTDYCELFIQRPGVDGVCCYYMHYFEALLPSGPMLVVM